MRTVCLYERSSNGWRSVGCFVICACFHPNRSECFLVVSHKKTLTICQLLIEHVKNSNDVKNNPSTVCRDGSTISFIAWIHEIHRLRMSIKEMNMVEY